MESKPPQETSTRADGLITAFDQVPGPIAYVDNQLVCRYANREFAAWLGMTACDLVGKPLLDHTQLHHPTLGEQAEAALRGQLRDFEATIGSGEGAKRVLRTVAAPHTNADGTVLGAMIMLDNAPHMHRPSAPLHDLRHACDQGMEGFALHDENGLFTYVNPAQAAIYGYDANEIVGQSWRLFYGPEETARIDTMVFPEVQTHGRWRGELKGQHKSGTAIDVEVSLAMLYDDHGTPCGLVCNCRDITERKLAEESLRQLQRVDALGQLTGGIAHDFNNLLAVMVGNLDLISNSPGLPADCRDHLAHAQRAAGSAAALTNRLLAFSRKQSLDPRVVDVPTLLAEMKDMLTRSLGTGIAVEVEHGKDLWSCAVDEAELTNAVLNLAINARDAMAGDGVIRIVTRNREHATDGNTSTRFASTQMTAQERPCGETGTRFASTQMTAQERPCGETGTRFVALSVVDTGTGMPPEVRERMFDPFFTTKGAEEGNGLGLSAVHGFVTQSGGSLEVESEPGMGTTVTLLLPLAEQVSQARQGEQPDAAPDGAGNTVLVIDDNPQVMATTRRLLEGFNFKTLGAISGQDAIGIASTHQLDLVLSDVALPGSLNGPDLVAEIRRRHGPLPAVLMSGHPMDNAPSRSAMPVVRKPFHAESLARTVLATLQSETDLK